MSLNTDYSRSKCLSHFENVEPSMQEQNFSSAGNQRCETLTSYPILQRGWASRSVEADWCASCGPAAPAACCTRCPTWSWPTGGTAAEPPPPCTSLCPAPRARQRAGWRWFESRAPAERRSVCWSSELQRGRWWWRPAGWCRHTAERSARSCSAAETLRKTWEKIWTLRAKTCWNAWWLKKTYRRINSSRIKSNLDEKTNDQERFLYTLNLTTALCFGFCLTLSLKI